MQCPSDISRPSQSDSHTHLDSPLLQVCTLPMDTRRLEWPSDACAPDSAFDTAPLYLLKLVVIPGAAAARSSCGKLLAALYDKAVEVFIVAAAICDPQLRGLRSGS